MPRRILAIDDCRECAYAAVLARTYHDGIRALKFFPKWDELHLDHDLCAVEHQSTESGKELTGYDVLCWLEENSEYLPKKIKLLTDNPSGRVKMEMVLKKLYPEG